jgi:hypothetical protein
MSHDHYPYADSIGCLVCEAEKRGQALELLRQWRDAGGDWGKVQAWIVNGAPTRAEGIEAAKRITRLNAMTDEVLALWK